MKSTKNKTLRQLSAYSYNKTNGFTSFTKQALITGILLFGIIIFPHYKINATIVVPDDTLSINDSPKMSDTIIVQNVEETPITSEFVDTGEPEDRIFRKVAEAPSFPGGQNAMFKYIDKNFNYPKKASHIAGRIILLFVVRKDGSIDDIKVLQSLTPELDEEFVRVVRSMPKWIPGKQNGKPVSVYYSIPMRFK
jgi:TonB family protein